ncbi:putative secretory lipase [Gongronella butleri]|nr:putative secretory lipase [Gongronella butleri]
MRKASSNILSLVFLLSCLLGLVTARFDLQARADNDTKPPDPQNDPFYQPPDGFESAKPGTIFKSRTVPIAIFSHFKEKVTAVQLLYKTCDGLDKPTATVTTVLVPENAQTDKLLSYHVMTDSVNPKCAPSYDFQHHNGDHGILTQAEILLINACLQKGWIVTVPDYEGPNMMFTVGRMAAHGILDGIRATLASGNLTTVQPDAQVLMWGYSGGALAGAWAAAVHPTYAPELKIDGAALGGTAIDLNATLNAVDGKLFMGLIPAGIMGLSRQYPDLYTYFKSVVKPLMWPALEAWVNHACLMSEIVVGAYKKIHWFTTNDHYMDNPIATRVLNENNLNLYNGTPSIPIFLYHCKRDAVVPFPPAQKLYSQWCDAGVNVQMNIDRVCDHVVLAIDGAPNAIYWLENLFKGGSAQQGCSSKVVVSSITNRHAMAAFGRLIWADLKALLKIPIGPHTIA